MDGWLRYVNHRSITFLVKNVKLDTWTRIIKLVINYFLYTVRRSRETVVLFYNTTPSLLLNCKHLCSWPPTVCTDSIENTVETWSGYKTNHCVHFSQFLQHLSIDVFSSLCAIVSHVWTTGLDQAKHGSLPVHSMPFQLHSASRYVFLLSVRKTPAFTTRTYYVIFI